MDETSVVPAVNQIELHPQLQQAESRAFHARHNIVTEAWSPLGQGKGLLEDPTIVALPSKHGKTPAQVVLRWHLQLGNVVIPKSVTPSRIAENIDVFDFELDDEDLAASPRLDTATASARTRPPSTWPDRRPVAAPPGSSGRRRRVPEWRAGRTPGSVEGECGVAPAACRQGPVPLRPAPPRCPRHGRCPQRGGHDA